MLLQPVQFCTLILHSYHSYYFIIKKGTKVSVKLSSNQKLYELVSYTRKFIGGLVTMQFPWLKTFQTKEVKM